MKSHQKHQQKNIQSYNYSGTEFFYDKTFEDYPAFSKDIISLINLYINSNIIPWHINEYGIHSFVFNGVTLKSLGVSLIMSNYFKNLTLDSFMPLNTPIRSNQCRFIHYIASDDDIVLHKDLKIISMRVIAIRNENHYFTSEFFITANLETLEEMPL